MKIDATGSLEYLLMMRNTTASQAPIDPTEILGDFKSISPQYSPWACVLGEDLWTVFFLWGNLCDQSITHLIIFICWTCYFSFLDRHTLNLHFWVNQTSLIDKRINDTVRSKQTEGSWYKKSQIWNLFYLNV